MSEGNLADLGRGLCEQVSAVEARLTATVAKMEIIERRLAGHANELDSLISRFSDKLSDQGSDLKESHKIIFELQKFASSQASQMADLREMHASLKSSVQSTLALAEAVRGLAQKNGTSHNVPQLSGTGFLLLTAISSIAAIVLHFLGVPIWVASR